MCWGAGRRPRAQFVEVNVRGVPEMGSQTKFEVHAETETGKAVLTPVGELDLATVPELKRAASEMLGKRVRELTIDLSQVTFMDSAGLRLLLTLQDEACEDGWTLRLLRPAERPRALFRLTGLDAHLPLVNELR
jgi:anti-sigma B factor antagonist